ncbi:DUF6384 family protein [Salinarimonas sp. NSM]|uniref:DUF6384 family protein n=1 Tax=Salinarimonas sp. NSM TaxID=3458003 RepID=UPI0040367F2E
MAGGVDAERGGLDELMLAMDVVDTLRHEEAALTREISRDEREDVLMERLRGLYAAQGIAVTDEALHAGIAALREKRFAYVRRGSALGRRLAGLWIARGKIAAVAGLVLLIAVGGVGWSAWRAGEAERARIAQAELIGSVLPQRLSAAHAAALAEARVPDAREQADALRTRAEGYLAAGDAARASATVAELEALRDALALSYVLRIVVDEEIPTGVFRIPDANERARNYYLVVQPIGPDGRVLELPVESEETNETTRVSVFGVRVPERTFEAVRRDKEDDGIIRDDVLGEKPRGALDVEWAMPVEGGRITDW